MFKQQLIKFYTHTISNAKIFEYHLELDRRIESDRKVILEDLIGLTYMTPKFNRTIIRKLQRATEITQLVEASYDVTDLIVTLKEAINLIKENV